MRPFTMWCVYAPRGYPWDNGAGRRRADVLRAFMRGDVQGRTWSWYYRRGWRCVRVVCTPAAGDRREADRG